MDGFVFWSSCLTDRLSRSRLILPCLAFHPLPGSLRIAPVSATSSTSLSSPNRELFAHIERYQAIECYQTRTSTNKHERGKHRKTPPLVALARGGVFLKPCEMLRSHGFSTYRMLVLLFWFQEFIACFLHKSSGIGIRYTHTLYTCA